MREHGVEAWGCFIVNPEWEVDDFIELEDFVRDHEIAFPQYTVLTPLPGTPLTDGMIAAGVLDISKLESQLLDFLHATTRTRLPLSIFYERMASLYETPECVAVLRSTSELFETASCHANGFRPRWEGVYGDSLPSCATWTVTSKLMSYWVKRFPSSGRNGTAQVVFTTHCPVRL